MKVKFLLTILLFAWQPVFAVEKISSISITDSKQKVFNRGTIFPGEHCPSWTWVSHRLKFFDNFQGITVYPKVDSSFAITNYTRKENFFTVVVSEPPPQVTQKDFEKIGKDLDEVDTYYYCDDPIGEDGRKRDVIFQIENEQNLKDLLSKLSKLILGKNVSVSQIKNEFPQKKVSYNLEVKSHQLLQMVHFGFEKEIGSLSNPNYKYFLKNRILEPSDAKREGIILFRVDKSIDNNPTFKDEFRLFSLKTDLLIGAITLPNSNSVLLIGRKRQISASIYPPMRYETLLRLANAAKVEKYNAQKLKEAILLEQQYIANYGSYQKLKQEKLNELRDTNFFCNHKGKSHYQINDKDIPIIIQHDGEPKIPYGQGYIEVDHGTCKTEKKRNYITESSSSSSVYVYEKDNGLPTNLTYSEIQMQGGLLNQSFERQRTQKISSYGKRKGILYSDITPNYLTEYTNDTEIGQALTIADMHLKGGSEQGKVEYRNYEKFPKLKNKTAFEEVNDLGYNSLIYNWNGIGKFAKSKREKVTVYSMNSTGAMHSSFIVTDGEKESSKDKIKNLEIEYNQRFNESSSYTLANVVKYNFLKEVFKENEISVKGDFKTSKTNPKELKKVCEVEEHKAKTDPSLEVNSLYTRILSKGKTDKTSWLVTPSIIRSQNKLGGIGGHNNDYPLCQFEYTTKKNTFEVKKSNDLGRTKYKLTLSEKYYEFQDEIRKKVEANPDIDIQNLKSEYDKKTKEEDFLSKPITQTENKKFLTAGKDNDPPLPEPPKNKDQIIENKNDDSRFSNELQSHIEWNKEGFKGSHLQNRLEKGEMENEYLNTNDYFFMKK